MIAFSTQIWISLVISVLAGVIVTIVVLLTRILFYYVRDLLPAGSLFSGIRNASNNCMIFIRRMTDLEQSGRYLSPTPNYSPISKDSKIQYSAQFKKNQNIPWVTSTATAMAMAHILNVLGRIGRSENIEITYHDKDYERWDSPMIIIGGGWKAHRALKTCNPYYQLQPNGFTLISSGEAFPPKCDEEDIGLLEKMINPTNNQPIWLIHGYRGAGVVSASYALVRWWRYLGWIYGKKPFALLVSFNDRDGWQQSNIISLYPKPNWFTKLIHPHSWHKLKNMIKRR